jgi:hypothetical protein
MKNRIAFPILVLLALCCIASASFAQGREYHVSVNGDDANDGSAAAMLKTVSAAALKAQPGDTITVHAGIYRERINPPRGGESDEKRIVYQAAPGEKVEIRGSEVVKDWVKDVNDTWKVTIPNTFFGDYNPYGDLIRGDWFSPKDRPHHTGAVYLNGEWLIEAAKLDEALAPEGTAPAWLVQGGSQCLLNVAWFRPGNGSEGTPRIPATSFTAKNGTQNAPCTEGGECVGWIMHGHWLKYEKMDFGRKTEELEIRAAAVADDGIIEIRLDTPEGELLGSCAVPNTGDWQAWVSCKAKIKPVSGVKTLYFVFKSRTQSTLESKLWFAQVDEKNTTIWAQFKGVNPNEQTVEINVRQTVFYPEQTNMNYITLRGFALRHAATQWAPPTSEQVGLVGTNWSKGWIIENNDVSHSVCSGIALGKHGDEFDNTSADTAEGYVKTIERAHARGWNKDTIGSHIVRNNHISHCEQTGIVGSMGCSFSTVTGNVIHDIHVRRLFTGAEMAGIKFHGAIDVEIRNNHIYRTCLGLWLDWMAQGARVSQNLFHDNLGQDIFVEVDHGPFVIDNNLLLSGTSLLSVSQGGAYIHNLFAGAINPYPYDARLTPFHKAHSTELAGMHDNPSGDDRYYNNVFIERADLGLYNKAKMPVFMDGNVFLKGAKPSKHEKDPLVQRKVDPGMRLIEKEDGCYLEITLDKAWASERARKPADTARLGIASIPNLPYENRDGSPLNIDTDYLSAKISEANPFPGPFAVAEGGAQVIKVWPVNAVK